MSVQTTLVIIAGHKFPKEFKLPDNFDVPAKNDFSNFETSSGENMDGNLKFLIGDDYTILGLPLSVTYLDEGEYLNPYTIGDKAPAVISTVTEQIRQISEKLGLSINPDDVKIHVLTHIT